VDRRDDVWRRIDRAGAPRKGGQLDTAPCELRAHRAVEQGHELAHRRLETNARRIMLGKHDPDEKIELECPKCGARFEVRTKDADSGEVRCPRGHEVPVIGILGGDLGSGPKPAS
jgi:hypothetical protein